MNSAEECIHGLTGRSCTICIHGPAPRSVDRQISECRSCSAAIIWVETEKGKKMPIDAEPGTGGRFALSADGRTVSFVHTHLARDDLYASHFETCPDAVGWKRSR